MCIFVKSSTDCVVSIKHTLYVLLKVFWTFLKQKI